MKRILAIALIVVLVAGTLVLPILHLAHCHDHDGCAGHEGHKGHDSSHCPLCQLVNAPMHDSVPQIETVAATAPYIFVAVSPRLVPAAVPGGSAQARAPPVA